MFATSSTLSSVPMETSATSRRRLSTLGSSTSLKSNAFTLRMGGRADEKAGILKVRELAKQHPQISQKGPYLLRVPIRATMIAYERWSGMISDNSGKCQPFHSRRRIAYVLISLSRSSSRPIA